MSIISWIITGLLAGSLAKMISPQQESGGWVASIGLGILGSIAGGFLFSIIGFHATSFIADIIVATVGAVILLFVYHNYISKKSEIEQ